MTQPPGPSVALDDSAHPVELVDSDITLETQRRRKHERLYMAAYALASLACYGVILAVAIAVLPLKIASVVGAGPAATGLSIVTGIASIAMIIAAPVFGRLSDMTTWSRGMRRPWLLVATALTVVGLVVTAFASNVPTMALGWFLAQGGATGAIAVVVASVPDQFPVSRRGGISGVIGATQVFGIVVITAIVQAFGTDYTLGFLVPAGIMLVSCTLFALVLRDRVQTRAEVQPAKLTDILTTFWVNPVTHRDFGFAWLSRFLIFAGIAGINGYQAYYLISTMHVDPATVGGVIALGQLVLALASTVGAVIAGRLSDRLGRRKPFVIIAAIIFAVGLAVVAMSPSMVAFFVGMAILGIGQGVYLAVDLALVTQVLPNQRDAGKDLGVINIAASLPTPLLAAIAPAILSIGATDGGGNYPALFLFAAGLAVLGAVAILPIRGVR